MMLLRRTVLFDSSTRAGRICLSALLLTLAAGSLPAHAQSHSRRHSHADPAWVKAWQQEWRAKHGSTAAAPVTTPKPAQNAAPSAPVSSLPANPQTSTRRSAAAAATPAASAAQTGKVAATSPANDSAPHHTVPSATSIVNPAPPARSATDQMPAASAPNAAPNTSPAHAPNDALTPLANKANGAAATPDVGKPLADKHRIPNTQSSTPERPTPNTDLLAQTKPDVFAANDPALGSTKTGDHTQDNPMAPVGDSWRMLAYLLPTLLVLVGGLNLLKRFQMRHGRLPGAVQTAARLTNGNGRNSQRASGGLLNALVGSFHMNNARQRGGSSIRFIESMPIGNANVHLIEVRGRVLLLGACGAGLRLLAEFEEQAGASSDDFRDLLHAAAEDMDALDYTQDDLPTTATVATLESLMRDAGQTVSKNSRRLRTVRQAEGSDD